LTLPGRFERLAGPAWRFERLAYRGGDTNVAVFLDSTARKGNWTCVADCARVKERALCLDDIAGRPTWIETQLVITPEHFPPRRALYLTEARIPITDSLFLVYQSSTRYADVQIELLAALRRLHVPATLP
jgi:hypothetical protein